MKMPSRRVFLRHGGMALVSVGFAPSFLERTIEAAGPKRQKVLITIFQRGAVDGLSMIVPFGEAGYYSARPSIAIPRPNGDGGAVDLDGFFGLHPRLAPLAPLWQSRQLAIVHACGSPDGTRSHFDAQDYMETATPGVKSTPDGWLNRYLHAREHADATPFRAVALSGQLPRSLQGSEPALAIGELGRFGIQSGAVGDIQTWFESEYAAAADKVLNRTGSEAFDAVHLLKSADPSKYCPENGAEYPRSVFGQALRQIAQLVKADVGLEIAFAEAGGWDTHVNQGSSAGQLAGRLDDFGRGIAALVRDLGERMADVVILTMSEFGRAVTENGNRGTDHGHGNAMMIISGQHVRGGKVYGRWPGLAPEQRYERRDLAVTTDFRSVFGEVVRGHLGVTDTSAIFPGFTASQPLGFLA
jgi:uncharacterized protein (DUF1501 family)